MPQLIIKIKDKIAKPLNNCVICDNSDYTVKFIFDEEWEKEPLRIARFIWNKQYVDVQFTGDTCEVPVVSKTNNLAIGVYAGDLRTTTPAILTCYTSILSEDVVEHSVTPSEYEEIMKLLNAQATDIAALKATDKRIWTNLDTINRTASTAKTKAEEGVAKADDALTATRTNATNITNLQTDVTDLINEKNIMGSRLTKAETTLNNVKTTAETAETKADSALARNIFTDEEKAKLANITNPIIIKGRVNTVQDLPTEAKIGWFYFVGLESASSYEEYCYSEKGWEYIGLSKEGVDLSNYYTKKQVDTTVNALKATDTSLGTRIDNVDSKASTAKTKAEEGVAKADNALTAAGTNATNIANLRNDVTDLIDEKNTMGSRLTTAERNIATLQTAYNKIDAHANNIAINRTTLGTQCKNLFDPNAVNWYQPTKTSIAKDGTITSTATSDSRVWGIANAEYFLTLSAGKYIIRTETETIDNKVSINQGIKGYNKSGTQLFDIYPNVIGTRTTSFTLTETTTIAIMFKLFTQTCKIMIYDADITDDTYEPYKESVDERLIKNKSDIAVNKTTLGTQCKNLLKNTAVTKTINGVTFTVNNDKSITVNGTATNRIIFLVGTAYISQTGNYTYTGTPSGGAASTYSMNYRNSNVYKTAETGNGITAQFEGGKTYEAVIDIRSGVTISNLTFKPMLRYADITDDTYEPYKENVDKRLIKNKSDIAVNKTTLGYQSKNLLKLTLKTKTVSGITFTVNDDYSITLNGTATAIIWQEIGAIGGNNFRKEKLIFTGNPAGTGSGAGLEAWYMNSTTGNKYISIANGDILTESDYDPSGAISYEFHINQGKTYNNVTFYPMLRYADITDSTYEPYKESVDERLINNRSDIAVNKSDIAVNKSTLGYHCKNLLNETEYLSSITSVSIGTFNISGNSITLTATGKDCYTKPHTSSDGGYRIPVEPDTDYILSWESDNTYAGLVYVFMNGNLSQLKHANNNGSKRLKFTTKSDTTFITIRLGVATSGNSITYSNIMLRYANITDDTYEPYQPSVQEQTPYSLSVSGKSTSAAISYSGVPTLICLTPNTADSTTGGLYMINSAGAVIKLIEKTGVVVATNTANNTFTITNNTTTVMDVCISRCWGR